MSATTTVKDLIRMLSDYHPNADVYLDVILPGGTERMTSPIDGVDLHVHAEEYRGNVIVVNAQQRLGGDSYFHLRQGALEQLFDRTDEEGDELHGWAGKDDCQGDGVKTRIPVRGSVRPSGEPDVDDVDDWDDPDWVHDPETNDTGYSMVSKSGRVIRYSTDMYDPTEERSSSLYVYTFSEGCTMADLSAAKKVLVANGVSLNGYSCQHSHDCCGRWYPNAVEFRMENGRLVAEQSWYQNV